MTTVSAPKTPPVVSPCASPPSPTSTNGSAAPVVSPGIVSSYSSWCRSGVPAHGVPLAPPMVLDRRLLGDLASRFLVNLPASELADVNRRFYHLEQAFWYYLDFCSGWSVELIRARSRATQTFVDFACPLLSLLGPNSGCPAAEVNPITLRQQYQRYVQDYKYNIPVAGCILFASPTPTNTSQPKSPPPSPPPPNALPPPSAPTSLTTPAKAAVTASVPPPSAPSSSSVASVPKAVDGDAKTMEWFVLMVGAVTTPNYGPPKGKVNQGESLPEAATREVLEEVGFRVKKLPDESSGWKVGKATFFPVSDDVSLDFPFQPNTRGEIESVVWIPVVPLHVLKASGINLTKMAISIWPNVLQHARSLQKPRPHTVSS